MLNCRLLCLMVFALPAMAGAAGNSPVVAIADDYLARYAATFPEAGTSNDLPGTDNGALSDNTPQALTRWWAYENDTLARLRAARLGTDSPESERVLHGVLQDELERSIGVRVCLRRRRA